MVKWFHLALGGVAGTFSRYFLNNLMHRVFGSKFPYGTLTVNLIGCFIIGFLVHLIDKKLLLGENARLLLVVGFCGAFTTFSAFISETHGLLKGGEFFSALTNVVASIAVGFIAFRLGAFVGDKF